MRAIDFGRDSHNVILSMAAEPTPLLLRAVFGTAHANPRHEQERRVADELEQTAEPAMRILTPSDAV
jgi:hypothetical protein